MGFRINTNVAAMNAHTNANVNNRNLDNSLSKLSSGLRINKAADDASGMVIANALRSQASSLGQAISNGNDAIGLIQTADGALDEYSKILDTIKTKSVQAASDGQNTASRLAIQKDIDRLMEELNVISKTTSFNGQKLLSGTFVNKEFQMGANANESIKASIASTETTQVGQTTRGTLNLSSLAETNQLSLQSAATGKTIDLESFSLKMNNSPTNGMGNVADLINKYSGETGITAKAVVNSTTGNIAAGSTGADFSINGINIGDVQVSANDSQGTLMNAINSKTNQTGVTASRTEDGKLTLSSTDGRAIQVSGSTAGTVLGKTTDAMSTFGHLEVVQAGSSTFQIKGAELAGAVGEDITSKEAMRTIQDSTLAKDSTISSGSTLSVGTVFGADIEVAADFFGTGDNTLISDATIGVGSTLDSGSVLGKGTVVQGTLEVATKTLEQDMLVKAGSVLATGTKMAIGTVLNQDISKTDGTVYKAGTVLTSELEIDDKVTLTKDMTLNYIDSTNASTIGSGSLLTTGTVLGADISASKSFTNTADMTIKKGSVLVTGSTMKIGTSFSQNVIVSGDVTVDTDMSVKAGSTLVTGSVLKKGSTIGGQIKLNAAIQLGINEEDMLIKAGSILKKDTVIKAGTTLQQDLTAAQVTSGNVGSGLKAGSVLGEDVTLQADMVVSKDFIFKTSTDDDDKAKIAADSTLATNGTNENSATLKDVEFSNLADIDVTTLDGAMKAMDTLSAAIKDLDTIRSDLGSVQNQLVATINNISVTQVNVKAAESQLRDVDFAAESANFSKFNILAQSGSYAMSQANAVQQNVLRLLQ